MENLLNKNNLLLDIENNNEEPKTTIQNGKKSFFRKYFLEGIYFMDSRRF